MKVPPQSFAQTQSQTCAGPAKISNIQNGKVGICIRLILLRGETVNLRI